MVLHFSGQSFGSSCSYDSMNRLSNRNNQSGSFRLNDIISYTITGQGANLTDSSVDNYVNAKTDPGKISISVPARSLSAVANLLRIKSMMLRVVVPKAFGIAGFQTSYEFEKSTNPKIR
jgi:hypothetical protein